jgi:hypothetical protein
MKVFWFKVYYPRTGAHVNVQFAPDLATAYASQVRAAVTIPRAMNAKYPRQPQPVASRIAAMQPPSAAHLAQTDPAFQKYLDAYLALLDNDPAPVEPSGSDRSPIL